MGMNILLMMIPLSLLFIGLAIWLFFWAVDHDQFDNLEDQGVLPLADKVDETEVPLDKN